jgi:hypothetical protein
LTYNTLAKILFILFRCLGERKKIKGGLNMITWQVSIALITLGIILALGVGIRIGKRSAKLDSVLNRVTSEFHHVNLNYQLTTPLFICTIHDGAHSCYGKSDNAVGAIESALQATREARVGYSFSELAGT